MVSELLRKYIWLVQTFIKEGDRGLSLEEILDKWEVRWGSAYSRRTFNNHRLAIEEVFGIKIECNRSSMRYFVRYSEDLKDEEAGPAWLINTFTVNSLLALGKERLSGRISVEDIPSGQKYLTVIMEAMLDDKQINISYCKYTGNEVEEFNVMPYALKEFAKRWYMIGYCRERKDLRVYGLDRIAFMKVSEESFKLPEGFDVDEIFASSFGIYLPGGSKAVDIVFRANEKEARYLRDLPLHHSQKELGISEEGVVFSVHLVPNSNLIMEFCKRGDRLEVLEPQDVRGQVVEELRRACDLYSDQGRAC